VAPFALLLLGVAPAAAGGAQYERLAAVLHVHSDLTTGDFQLEQLQTMAEKAGVGAILLSENYLLRIEYGLPPFRALTRIVREERSVLGLGVERFLQRVAEARARNPRVLLLAGVEVLPHYHWTGAPWRLDMELHDTQKNLLVFGVSDPAALQALPATSNPGAGVFDAAAALDLVPVLLVVPGAVLVATKRRALARVGRTVVVVRRRRLFLGGLLLALGATALVRAWPFVTAPYSPYRELGPGPHQALIDYVDRLGGATVWSFPEARDSGEQWVGPVRVAWRTDPYTDDLQRTARYTAFGAIYEDTTRFELPGGGWDRLLSQYTTGARSRPAWAVGESGFHGWSAGKAVGPIQTVFLVAERSERGVLEALRRGRMYALQRPAAAGLALAQFAVRAGERAAISGETLAAPAGTALEVHVAVEALDGSARDVRATLVRNGAVVAVWAGRTPFRQVHREVFDGAPAFYRLDTRGLGRLLSNPIFVKAP
jgi:hypothetical protein